MNDHAVESHGITITSDDGLTVTVVAERFNDWRSWLGRRPWQVHIRVGTEGFSTGGYLRQRISETAVERMIRRLALTTTAATSDAALSTQATPATSEETP